MLKKIMQTICSILTSIDPEPTVIRKRVAALISRWCGIEITSPPDNSRYEPGVPIELRALRKIGTSSSIDIRWSSSIDGTLGTGDALTIPDLSVGRDPLSLGQHVIQAGIRGPDYRLKWRDDISLTVTPCTESDEYDVDANGIPQFVRVNYIELDKIHKISRFRSGIGHDSADDFESCRSMKHYFHPKEDVNWSTVQIFSPINGNVMRTHHECYDGEWVGTKVEIKSEVCPALSVAIYHVNLTNSLNDEQRVVAGQQLGTHIGSQTYSDIEVVVNTPNGRKKISYFDVMTDSLFQEYKARGLDSRSDAIISKEDRDADPLNCDREWNEEGNIENWVTLD